MKIDQIITFAQLLLTVSFVGGYFAVVILFMLGTVHVPQGYQEVFTACLGVLTGGIVTIIAFWFNRPRSSGVPS
jgi:hypothetical protein